MSENILVGKILTGVKIAADKEAMLFQTTAGDIVVRCDADCCSHTWIEHVELPALGFPALVMVAENLDMNKAAEDTDDGDYIQFYGFKITTDRGEIVIDYRNSSNGYYGGSLSWPGSHEGDAEYFYGGVYGQNVSEMQWVEVAP